MEALYQLSYSPEGGLKLPPDAPDAIWRGWRTGTFGEVPDTPSSPEQRTIAQRARSRLSQQAARRLPITGPVGWMGALPRDRFLDVAYRAILGRPADPGGVAHFGDVLDGGADRSEVLAQLRDSAEAQQLPAGSELAALHRSRQVLNRKQRAAPRTDDAALFQPDPDGNHVFGHLPNHGERRQTQAYLGRPHETGNSCP